VFKSKAVKQSKEQYCIDVPSEDELIKFYDCLNSSDVKPAILKITPPYSQQFIPMGMNESLPQPISQLYDPDALQLDYLSPLNRCEEIARNLKVVYFAKSINIFKNTFQIPLEQVMLLEQSTRKQAKCKLCKVHHEGRITASNFKAVARKIRVYLQRV